MPCNHDSKSYQNTSHVIRLLFAVTDSNLHKTRYPVHTLRTCTYEQARCTGTVANIWFVYTSTGNLLIWTSEIRTLRHAGHIMVVPNAAFAYKLTSEIMAPPISGHLKWSRVSGLGSTVPLQPYTCTTVYTHTQAHVSEGTHVYIQHILNALIQHKQHQKSNSKGLLQGLHFLLNTSYVCRACVLLYRKQALHHKLNY